MRGAEKMQAELDRELLEQRFGSADWLGWGPGGRHGTVADLSDGQCADVAQIVRELDALPTDEARRALVLRLRREEVSKPATEKRPWVVGILAAIQHVFLGAVHAVDGADVRNEAPNARPRPSAPKTQAELDDELLEDRLGHVEWSGFDPDDPARTRTIRDLPPSERTEAAQLIRDIEGIADREERRAFVARLYEAEARPWMASIVMDFLFELLPRSSSGTKTNAPGGAA